MARSWIGDGGYVFMEDIKYKSKAVPQPPCKRQRGQGQLLIVDLGTRWGEFSASRPAHALSLGNYPRYPLDRLCGSLSAGLDTEARGKILCLCLGSNPCGPVAQSVVRHYNTRIFIFTMYWLRWPRGLKAAWLLGSRIRISLKAWMFVSCVCTLCCPV
jgi:hypothetical protein